MVFFAWRRSGALRALAKWRTGWVRPAACAPAAKIACITGLTKGQVEDLLDWLEATGQPLGEVVYRPGEGFTVYYHSGGPG